MMFRNLGRFALIVSLTLTARAAAGDGKASHWPSFRGPDASGVAEGATPPTAWDARKEKNIKWKTPIPGLGHSCPVIWGDKLFVTTAVSGDENNELRVGLYGNIQPVEDDSVHTWHVFCLDKNTGEILWNQTAHEGVPKIKRHTKATHANSTVATDGEYVVAFFGSEGLYCYRVSGERAWKKDFGVLDAGYYVVPPAQWEYGSSPIIHDGKVIVLCDVQKDSFIAALDVKNGEELWRTPRNDVPTWGTPTVHTSDGRSQVIVNGYKHTGAYDLETGAELWKLVGGGDIPVPTPIVAHDLIYITNAHGSMAPIYAIRTNAVGDISLTDGEKSNEYVKWAKTRAGNYMQTPLVYGDYLYSCKDNGVMSCYDAKTGKKIYRHRLGDGSTGFTPSPVAADGKLYYTSEEGDVYVVKTGPEFELLATNPLGEVCMATPAISDSRIYFRTQSHVVAVGD